MGQRPATDLHGPATLSLPYRKPSRVALLQPSTFQKQQPAAISARQQTDVG